MKALEPLKSLKAMSRHLKSLVRERLWLQVLVGMFLGVLMGLALSPEINWVEYNNAKALVEWIALPGQIFLALIQMIVIPLVMASIVRGISASDNLEQLKSIGLKSVFFFVTATILSICIGIGLCLLIGPGHFIHGKSLPPEEASPEVGAPMESLPQLIFRIIPSNPLSSMIEFEMLPVVFFSAVVGIALLSLRRDQSALLLSLFAAIQEVCMVVVKGAMRLAPLAVFGLMSQAVFRVGFEALVGLSAYVACVLLGLLILMGGYLLFVQLVIRRAAWVFLRDMRELLLLAFSTSSSAAVMPLSIKTAEDRFQVRPSISQFVIPLGATINMTGTSLYQGVATVFLAQVFGVDLG
ncbi:MAG: dicarboxylate/amino acid:cation symporter, partial [Bradymonadales bacterium]